LAGSVMASLAAAIWMEYSASRSRSAPRPIQLRCGRIGGNPGSVKRLAVGYRG